MPTLTMSQAALKRLFLLTTFAMSTEESRFVLTGTLVKVSGRTITLVATDGRRLAVASAEASENQFGGLETILPAKTVRELIRLLEDDEERLVELAPLQDNQMLFKFGGVTLVSRLIEGQFPKYESVIPTKSTTTFACQREPLLAAIRRAALMTTATSQAVVFELSKNALVISKESPDVGSAQEELPTTYTGAPMRLAFNPEFFTDALKLLDDESVAVEISAADKPAVLRLPAYLYIVLPMKLA